jgi:hypothetical protein
LVLQAA